MYLVSTLHSIRYCKMATNIILRVGAEPKKGKSRLSPKLPLPSTFGLVSAAGRARLTLQHLHATTHYKELTREIFFHHYFYTNYKSYQYIYI